MGGPLSRSSFASAPIGFARGKRAPRLQQARVCPAGAGPQKPRKTHHYGREEKHLRPATTASLGNLLAACSTVAVAKRPSDFIGAKMRPWSRGISGRDYTLGIPLRVVFIRQMGAGSARTGRTEVRPYNGVMCIGTTRVR